MGMAVFEVSAAAFGGCIGSFLNVVIHRLQREDPRERSVGGRSHCPHCGAAIAWFDNVPVLSWLVLRARGRCCGKPISARYPFVELLTAGLFAALAWASPVGQVVAANGVHDFVVEPAVVFVLQAVFLSLLVALSFIDFDTQLLPDVLTKPGIALGLFGGLWPGVAGVISRDDSTPFAMRTLLASVLGCVAGGGVTWTIRALGSKAFGREAMGFGDVKLMAMVGAFLGWQSALLTLFLGCVFGAIVGGIGAALGRGTVIPFGPYLALGAVTSLFARDPILTAIFTTWPEWSRRHPSLQGWLVAGATGAMLLLLFVLRRARRSS
jgi:leader peptidase (prepilin peptidase)/N-methyltransferase